MKKTFTFYFSLLLPFLVFGQYLPKSMTGGQHAPVLAQPSPMPLVSAGTGAPSGFEVTSRDAEVQIGITRFEVQTNASLGRRVTTFPDGRVSAAWLHGINQAASWPDRGTAYNQFDGTGWDSPPTARLEADRSGSPSFTSTPNGLEVVVSHKNTSATQWFLHVHTKMPQETDWNVSQVPSTVPGGPVWAKVATGGPDGNTIHLVAAAVAPDFGGVNYQGVFQHPLYYRSTDAGATWDLVDVVIPGLDSNFYNTVPAEAYSIAANGSTVAVSLFTSWGDVAVFKSTDNGSTWTKTIINDFPLDKYDGSGYGPGDVPFDPAVPDSISIFSTDGSGSVLVDDQGNVHVFYSILYVYAQGANYFLNLTVDGIAYWNEDFGPGELEVIAAAPDIDGDGVVTVNGTFEQLRYGNTNLTSFPASSLDDEGNIYLVFSTLREDLVSVEQLTYRHVFVVKSTDGGVTWSEPFDLINPDVTEFYDFIEGVYASLPARLGERLDLVYLQDYEPGLTPANITIAEQFIMHVPFNKDSFEPVGTSHVPQLKGEVVLAPNPAGSQTELRFRLLENTDAKFSLLDLLGRQVYFSEMKNLPSGYHNIPISTGFLPNGVYFAMLEVGGNSVGKKLVVGR